MTQLTSHQKRLISLCAHANMSLPDHESNAPCVTPINQSSLFKLGAADEAEELFSGQKQGYTYTRFGNPTVDQLASTLAQMEGGASGVITSSGNGATLCALTAALQGKEDCIVSHKDVYGGTQELLRIFSESYHVPVIYANPWHIKEWENAISKSTVVYVETPSNPLLKIIDLKQTSQLCRKAGSQLIVDNTVATPYNQLPFQFGADWVIHSLSKYLNGHSDIISGCLLSKEPLKPQHRVVHKNLGGTVNAFEAWLVLRGLKTFPLRMAAHNQNGQAIAEWLSDHFSVAKVYYPSLDSHPQFDLFKQQMFGGSGLLSFELKGGLTQATRFINRLKLVVHAVSLGGMESVVTRPSVTSHRGMSAEAREASGISDGLIRLSVGTEEIDALLKDLAQALE